MREQNNQCIVCLRPLNTRQIKAKRVTCSKNCSRVYTRVGHRIYLKLLHKFTKGRLPPPSTALRHPIKYESPLPEDFMLPLVPNRDQPKTGPVDAPGRDINNLGIDRNIKKHPLPSKYTP